MHGLPQDFDATAFTGRVLESVTFAGNAIHLNFGADCSITVLNHVRYQVTSGADSDEDVLPVSTSNLPSLVGLQVERTKSRLLALALYFDGGGSAGGEDDSSHYESYSLQNTCRQCSRSWRSGDPAPVVPGPTQ